MNEQQQQNNGSLEGRVSTLERALEDFITADRAWKSELVESIRRLDDKAGAAGKTDFGTLALWAAILLTIIGMVAAPIGWALAKQDDSRKEEIKMVSGRVDSMEAKMQRQTEADLQELRQRRMRDEFEPVK